MHILVYKAAMKMFSDGVYKTIFYIMEFKSCRLLMIAYVYMCITPQPQFNNPNFENIVSYRLHFYIHEKLGTQRQYSPVIYMFMFALHFYEVLIFHKE